VPVRGGRGQGPTTGPGERRRGLGLPRDVVAEVLRAAPGPEGGRLAQRLTDAARSLERDRVIDAVRVSRPLARRLPDVAAVRELAGVALYRSGRWAEAARHLEAFAALSGSVDQLPALADCWRALGRYERVDALWEELRRTSPAPGVLAEGRIVAAGAKADRGDLLAAIRLLERAPDPRRGGVREHHVRTWYALADLYERVGDVPRARELFGRVVATEPALADAAERLDALGAGES